MSTPAPTHYQPTGSGPTPWDLQRTMQTSGSCFVDARRTDAIEYCYRIKGDAMLDDLKKARHCLDEAIGHLEGRPSPANMRPCTKCGQGILDMHLTGLVIGEADKESKWECWDCLRGEITVKPPPVIPQPKPGR